MYKYTWPLAVSVLLAGVAQATLITQAEYFFDSDPGFGAGTAVALTAGEEPSFTADLSTAGLDPGLHRFYLRYQDELGRWSIADCRLFYLNETNDPTAQRQIVAAEWFLDADPGFGAGTALALTPGGEVSVTADLDLAGQPTGLHRFYLRYQDELGRWSIADARLFYLNESLAAPDQREIVAAEWFLDTDPGFGSGTALTLTPGAEVSVTADLDLAGQSTGLHRFYLRYQDELGRWSIADARLFYLNESLAAPDQREIVAAEYFFDTDPGFGNGTAVAVTPGDQVSLAVSLDAEPLGYGLHRFYLRYQDELGRWSIADCRLFYKNEVFTPVGDQLLATAEYFINYDPGVGNGVAIDLPVDGDWDGLEESVAFQVDDVPVGRHWLGIRYRDTWGAWSSVKADSFLVGPLLDISRDGTPVTLTWEGDLDGDLIRIYRSENFNGPFALIDSTLDAGYTDLTPVPGNSKRFYYVTQDLDAPLSVYRNPVPADDPGYAQRVKAKRPFTRRVLPQREVAAPGLASEDPASLPLGVMEDAPVLTPPVKAAKRVEEDLR